MNLCRPICKLSWLESCVRPCVQLSVNTKNDIVSTESPTLHSYVLQILSDRGAFRQGGGGEFIDNSPLKSRKVKKAKIRRKIGKNVTYFINFFIFFCPDSLYGKRPDIGLVSNAMN